MMESPDRPMRHQVLSWADVDKLIDLLVPQLRGIGGFGGMVMITRGGLIPGGMLAEVLKIEHVLTASVNFPATNETRTALMVWPEFLQFPDAALIFGRRLLVVDDVWGSGRTSIAVRERLLADEALDAVRAAMVPGERLHARGREVYAFFGGGMGQSKAAEILNRKAARAVATGRNWNTVLKLAELAGA